jgi:lipid A 3-O-deacylase
VGAVRAARLPIRQNSACLGLAALPARRISRDWKETMNQIRSLLLAAGAAMALQSYAADLRPAGVFVQAGEGEHSMHATSVGAVWPWRWERATASGRWTAYTEAYLSRWSARTSGGRVDFDHVGVVPLFRYRANANPHWFAEGGIGLIYMNRLFVTPDKQFSTRLNFADTLGIGRSFGEREQHEVTLRFTHFSNGGMKHPNPGQNIVRLRYAYLFS